LDNLDLRKIITKIAVTRCILKLKCTKYDFGWSSPSAPLNSLSVLKGPTSKGKGGRQAGDEGKERKGEWR